MPDTPPRGRALTYLAVGFLLLDAVLLGLAGLWSRRPGLIGGAALCGGLALAVLLLWRRQRRLLAEMADAREAVQTEARALRDLLRR